MKKIFFIKNSVQYKIIMIMIEKILNIKKASYKNNCSK